MADLEKKNDKAKKPSVFARANKWWRELKGEVRKIVWPSKQQTINNILVVIAAVLIVGVFIWVLDAVFGLIVTSAINMIAG